MVGWWNIWCLDGWPALLGWWSPLSAMGVGGSVKQLSGWLVCWFSFFYPGMPLRGALGWSWSNWLFAVGCIAAGSCHFWGDGPGGWGIAAVHVPGIMPA